MSALFFVRSSKIIIPYDKMPVYVVAHLHVQTIGKNDLIAEPL